MNIFRRAGERLDAPRIRREAKPLGFLCRHERRLLDPARLQAQVLILFLLAKGREQLRPSLVAVSKRRAVKLVKAQAEPLQERLALGVQLNRRHALLVWHAV